ncbi:hypothetical protein Tco_0908499 [Tanacetum coccineum]|uniref:Uncharacterized protein n=1 Tax=Tanacetum coccineum TaxID=301880 RepID=A0ABQ5CTT0_9ASTR
MFEKTCMIHGKSRMESLYMMNRPHGRMILLLIEKGPLVWPSITEDGVTRLKEYVELTPAEAFKQIMPLEQFQVNTKFLNTLPDEWSKFVTDVKLLKDLHTTNVDQLHAYLQQHERHANEVGRQTTYAAGTTRKYTPGASGSNTGKQRIVICYNCKGESHIPSSQHPNAAYQADDLDCYDSDCDELNSVGLLSWRIFPGMAHDALTKSETCITSDSNIIPYYQYLSEAQQETV